MISYALLYIGVVAISILLLLLTIKIIRKKTIEVAKLSKVMLWYAFLIFIIPWIYWIYNISAVMKFQRVISETIRYFKEPFLLIFLAFSAILIILTFGISRLKNWLRIITIFVMSLIAILSSLFCLSSLYYYHFVSGDMDVMAAGILTYVIGPLVVIFLIWPSLLFLYCFTRKNVKGQFK